MPPLPLPPSLPALAVPLRGLCAGAARAAFSLDLVGGRLYLAAGYGGRDRGLTTDVWALPLPANASQAGCPPTWQPNC